MADLTAAVSHRTSNSASPDTARRFPEQTRASPEQTTERRERMRGSPEPTGELHERTRASPERSGRLLEDRRGPHYAELRNFLWLNEMRCAITRGVSLRGREGWCAPCSW